MLTRLFCAAAQHRNALKLLRVAAILTVLVVSLAVPSLVMAGPDGGGP